MKHLRHVLIVLRVYRADVKASLSRQKVPKAINK